MAATEDQPAPDLDSLTFEDAFRQLSEMAAQLEAGGLSLAEATARFEEGMKLVERCNTLLNTAEVKITQLKDSYRNDSLGAEALFPDPEETPEDEPEEELDAED